MNKRTKKLEKGITLIALVITIIVLLILAGVSIAMLTGDNGILTKSTEAKETNEQKTAEEQVKIAVAGSYGENGIIDIEELNKNLKSVSGLIYKGQLISDTNKISTLPAIVTLNKYSISIEKNGSVVKKVIADRTGIKVGDYVDYSPDSAEPYTSLSKSNTGSSKNSTSINQEDLNWKVLRIYDDGTIDLIGNQTAEIIYFESGLGYNNGVYFLNDICKSLYSKPSSSINARSINLKDLEYWLTDEGIIKRGSYSSAPITNNKKYSFYPKLYAYEKGAGINTTNVNTDGIDVSDESSKDFSVPTSEGCGEAYDYGLTFTPTYYGMEINEKYYGEGSRALRTEANYWVASRYVKEGYPNFGMYIRKFLFK